MSFTLRKIENSWDNTVPDSTLFYYMTLPLPLLYFTSLVKTQNTTAISLSVHHYKLKILLKKNI